jgi:hypothetical protein
LVGVLLGSILRVPRCLLIGIRKSQFALVSVIVNNPDLDSLDFREWIEYGVTNGWVSEPSCFHHDLLPTTEEEDVAMEEGDDPCIHVLRLWDV